MNKVLKKYTTIPENLYVVRNADKQLEQIVEDMQRPGYVLVARQMGKTNLLFHAKRTLESQNRLFIYVDLSNPFSTDRECYRNIIDSIVEPYEDLFETIVPNIEAIRGKNLPAHKEYESSLRAVLKLFQGNMVIVLDEIDALRSVNYSDNVFAQIRSNYFSRTNFPEFERLTYILSGVIEPTELIKDKNKSPFNIGEKIYLDDFSFEEYRSLIVKGELSLDADTIQEIYNWTHGNPRLTFELCSDIEDAILSGIEINKPLVDEIVNKKYFVNFDIPPIDHIRELVKSDKKIRDAVLNIHKKNFTEINDEIKTKLYLYGIISSNFNEEPVIKNEIIAKSLSEQWIESINKDSKNIFGYAISFITSRDYEQAIRTFKEFLGHSNLSTLEQETSNYYIGFALFHLNRIEDAIPYLSKEFKDKNLYRNAKSYLGLCYARLGEIQISKSLLLELTNEKINNFAYRNSVLNYSIFIRDENFTKALELLDSLYSTLNLPSEDDFSEEENNKLKTAINYYKAEIFYKINNLDAFNQSMKDALKTSLVADTLYLRYFSQAVNQTNQEPLKDYIFNTIINHKLLLEDNAELPYNFTRKHILIYLDLLHESKDKEKYLVLFEYATKWYFNDITEMELAKLLDFNFDNADCHFETYCQNKDIDDLSKLENIKNILTYAVNRDKSVKFETYFRIYEKLIFKLNVIQKDDIHLFAYEIRALIEENQIDEALKLCKRFEKLFSDIADINKLSQSEMLPIYYSQAQIHFKLSNKQEVIRYADLTLKSIESMNSPLSFDNDLVSTIFKEMRGFKYSANFLLDNYKSNYYIKKYKPNEKIKVKYLDNQVLVRKYKHVSSDIANGKCIIIEE